MENTAKSSKATRPINIIAKEILAEINSGSWSKSAAVYALPYLQAMQELSDIDDKYLLDSGRSIVLYFLSNASTWRGKTARRIKAELKGLLA